MNRKLIVPIALALVWALPAVAQDCAHPAGAMGDGTGIPAGISAAETCADEGDSAARRGQTQNTSFLSSFKWKWRVGATDFRVEDSNTFGVLAGIRGNYESANGIRVKLLFSAIADWDRDHLDPDHIPVWFKSYIKAEKALLPPDRTFNVLATLDFNHKMNTVSSIEQSADLMPGVKLRLAAHALELFARFGAGGYYLEIDDDLPRIYSDYSREDLSSAQFAWSQEYRAKFRFAEKFTLSGRYEKFRNSDFGTLETREELKLAYHMSPAHQLVFKAEKTIYNLDQFERSAGDNGLEVLPFDRDTCYLAYYEFDR